MTNKRILIVDDEASLRQLLGKVMKREGYEVFTGRDGAEGMEIFQNNPVDLIISDIKMPNMDGIEFLHSVKKADPSVAFVLITAFATTETAIDALKSGAQDYVTKPFDIDEILSVVNKLMVEEGAGSRTLEAIDADSDEDFKVTSKSEKMQKVLALAKQVAPASSTVLITGETGTGKEVISSAIHSWSSRSEKPIIKVNCGAIPDNLLESELFGYEKGAFTGAVSSKPGRFEVADGGTIFLDEIGDISPAIQVKLLRVIQEKTLERLGGIKTKKVDVRIIAATNKNLKKEVAEGRFRDDLYYRLNVVPIQLPPLRERTEDIEDLIYYFLKKSAGVSGGKVKSISDDAMDRLKRYSWPGNIRELENIIERAVVITPEDIISEDVLPPEIRNTASGDGDVHLTEALDNKEKETLIKAIRANGGNKTKAALELGISRRSLHRKIQKYDINE
ncbi:MAG: sigma-54 dependent transcriptional regulator [Eubacteriaceae bacterium]|nr:sigma-54 dependent transcriptional regulator [Eubacteriaceae bacterium]